jgi:hypothetical protein
MKKPISHGKSRVDVNIIPDVDDPNNYCKSCKLSFSSRNPYEALLKNLHGLMKGRGPQPNPNIVPDSSHSTNKHCASCNYTYKKRCTYTNHLKKHHSITVAYPNQVKGRRQDCLVKRDAADNFCKECNRHYVTETTYRRRLCKAHGLALNGDQL